MELRPATMDDAQRLFDWRNDPATRIASHQTGELHFSDHVAWLARALASDSRELYIAEHEGAAVGTVRADLSGAVTELSWTVAPEWRGHGFGKAMVGMLADQIRTPLKAEIKRDNVASQRIALAAGFTLAAEIDGVLHFTRNA